MLTRREIKERQLKEGKDYLYIGGVRYQSGDSFNHGIRTVTVKTIIDSYHFNSSDGCCWHTGMFHDYKCTHNTNMKPLEYDERAEDAIERRLRDKQIYLTNIFILHDGKNLENVGECLCRYVHKSSQYLTEINDNQCYRSNSFYASLSQAFGKNFLEVMFVLQNWGVSGKTCDSILIDDNCKKIKYEGFDHTVVCSGKMQGSNEIVTLLKRHAEPAQQFVLVGCLQELESGEYIGNNFCEDIDFSDAANSFYEYTGRSVERALKSEKEAEL